MLTPDRIVAAVAELAPESRALIELSARRGMGDGEIAELLRVDTAEVRRRRDAATQELARATGSTGSEVRDRLDRLDREAWEGGAAAAETRDTRSETERPMGRSPSTRAAVGAGLLASGAVVAAIVIASGGYDGDSDDRGAAPKPEAPSGGQTTAAERPAPEQPAQTGPRVTFQRLNGTYGRGTAQLISEGDSARLRVRVTSLLRPVGGGYALWVLNSPEDARQLLSTRETRLDSDLRFPRGYARYRYLELSREPTDDPGHSGLSLLRAPLEELGG